jgi:acyl carrier protein
MTADSAEHVKTLIRSILEPRLHAHRPDIDLSDELDLRDEGIIDSLGFLHLIAELEARLGPIDLTELAAEQLTNVGALARHIAHVTQSV